jgi:hypothetical protein
MRALHRHPHLRLDSAGHYCCIGCTPFAGTAFNGPTHAYQQSQPGHLSLRHCIWYVRVLAFPLDASGDKFSESTANQGTLAPEVRIRAIDSLKKINAYAKTKNVAVTMENRDDPPGTSAVAGAVPARPRPESIT